MRMKSLVTAATVGLVAMFTTVSARAEVKTFARAGVWEAFGGTSNDGQGLCGVSTRGGGKWIGVKYYKGDETITIQLSNESWTVTDKDKVSVVMKFDDESPWRASATAFHMSDGDAALEFSIKEDQMNIFMREFRQSDSLIIRFPDSKVEDWRANLAGTSRVADAMSECLRVLRR